MKIVIILTLFFGLHANSFAQITIKVKIESAEKNRGIIYVSVFNSEVAYEERAVYMSFVINADNETVTKDITLPKGQYVFSVYQDSNENGKLDTNLLGIPKEKFGFSNYNGKTPPGNYNKHKVAINEHYKEVMIKLYKI